MKCLLQALLETNAKNLKQSNAWSMDGIIGNIYTKTAMKNSLK